MRYVFQNKKENIGRLEYLFDIFKEKFCFVEEKDGFFIYEGPTLNKKGIFFITGHNDKVEFFLCNNKIKEKNIVINSCFIERITRIYKKKINNKKIKIYSSKITDKTLVYLYPGERYGFKFPITDSELNFYNDKNNHIMSKIKNSFKRV